MRFFILPAMFVTLLFLPGVSLAETAEECQNNCSIGLAASVANCPPSGKDNDTDQIHKQCLQDIQSSLRDCRAACLHAASMEAPVDVPADGPKDSLQERLTSTPPVAPPDSLKEMPQDMPPDAPK